MAEDAKTRDQKARTGTARGVILTDGVFSSIGTHVKGEKVELPESDVATLEAGGHITRI